MGRDDWYRNADWTAAIEEAFFAKLARARDKSQPLRIQASTLAKGHPPIALRLLDHYFKLGEHFHHAQAHVDRATAYLSLGDTEQAINAYEAALAVEAQRPKVLTQAYLDLPYLVAIERMVHRYPQALDLLQRYQKRLMFPVDFFRWHAAYALIKNQLGHHLDTNSTVTVPLQLSDKASRCIDPWTHM